MWIDTGDCRLEATIDHLFGESCSWPSPKGKEQLKPHPRHLGFPLAANVFKEEITESDGSYACVFTFR